MTYAQYMRECHERYMRTVLKECDGVVTKAAKMADVNRSTFYRMLHCAKRVEWKPRLYGNSAWRELDS